MKIGNQDGDLGGFVKVEHLEFILRQLTLSRPGGGRGGLLEPAPTLKICNFQTVKAITTKHGDFS